MHGSISDKDELMLKTAEFATKFIISPKKKGQNQSCANPPSLILREREREEQQIRRNKSKGATRRTAA